MCGKELCSEHSPEGFVAKDSGENAREILQSSHKQTKYKTLVRLCTPRRRGPRQEVEGRRLQERTWKPNLHAPERDVAVAERRADDPDPDLVRLGRVHDDLLDGQRLAGGPAHGRCASPEREAG